MSGKKRRKVEWRAAPEGGQAHAYLHEYHGVSAVSVCGLAHPAPWIESGDKCGPCLVALKRLW